MYYRHRPITLDLCDTDDKEFNLASYLRNREIDLCLSKVKWYGLENDPIDEAATLDPLKTKATAQYDESSLGANKGGASLQAVVNKSTESMNAVRAPAKTTALQRRRSASIAPDENSESPPNKPVAAAPPPPPSAEQTEALDALNLGPKPAGIRVLQFSVEERALMKKARRTHMESFFTFMKNVLLIVNDR